MTALGSDRCQATHSSDRSARRDARAAINMMLLLPGRERTRADWDALYGDAGLAISAMIPVPDTFGAFVIEEAAHRRRLAAPHSLELGIHFHVTVSGTCGSFGVFCQISSARCSPMTMTSWCSADQGSLQSKFEHVKRSKL
jgi:hypothetical protein